MEMYVFYFHYLQQILILVINGLQNVLNPKKKFNPQYYFMLGGD